MKHTYIHETHTIWANDGEVHIKNDNNTIHFRTNRYGLSNVQTVKCKI